MGSVIAEIEVDCVDPEPIARFWGQVLGWEVQRQADVLWMSASGVPSDADLKLVFAEVPEGKSVKNRLHIDLSPSGCDQAEELERLLGLGASRIDIGQGDVPWMVLADPGGNEFCLLKRRRD
jgi:predicted enzyme related to lactoylglutathione lyase